MISSVVTMGKDSQKRPLTAASQLREWLKDADIWVMRKEISQRLIAGAPEDILSAKTAFDLGQLIRIMRKMQKELRNNK